MVRVNDSITILDTELNWSFARSSGKGGQNVNKVNSKAVLRFQLRDSQSLPLDVQIRALEKFASQLTDDGEIIVTSERFRHQFQNVRDCVEKLRQMILSVLKAPKKRVATKPSRAAKKVRLETKKRHSQKKIQRSKKWLDT